MPLDVIFVFIILMIGVILFTTERVPFDVTALIILSSLIVTGILTPQEGLAGFSNEATVTIGAMFVLSQGVHKTGALNVVSDFFAWLGRRNFWLALTTMMGVIGVISAFINNTAAVAIFIPVILAMAPELDVSPAKLLMPLSFASMFGGVCTLISTSTNILVSSIAERYGQPAFSMLEFAPLGLLFFVTGFAYLFFVGIRLIPDRKNERQATARYDMESYLTDVTLQSDFEHYGQSVASSQFIDALDLDVVQVFRNDERHIAEGTQADLQPGDTLRIRGNAQEIKKLIAREDVALKPARAWEDADLETENYTLVEAVIAPDSGLQGQEIHAVNFPERFGAVLLAIRQRGKLQQDQMEHIRLSGGDSILLSMNRKRVIEVERDPSFVVVSEVGLTDYRRNKMVIALTILGGAIGVMISGLAPIVVTVLTACLLMILTGCLTIEEVYTAINWKVIFLLAGVLPLGTAMEKTGAAELMSNSILTVGQDWGPTLVVSLFFFLSMMLTNIISNQATAALLAPIAIQAAQTLGVDGRPFLMAITFAASLSFMTPVGYQTNTLIYGPGQYKFSDFIRVGTPLNFLFWIIGSLLIPMIWSF